MKLSVARLMIPLLALTAGWLPIRATAQNPAGGSDKLLSSYRDKNRVLLVFAASAQDDAYQEQVKLWQAEKAGFEDRQLIVVPILANAKKLAPEQAAQVSPLAKKHGIDANTFGVILIGKDGRDAFHSAKPVTPAALYAFIDAMPMRRAEMKRQAPASPSPTPTPTPRRPDVDHDE